MRWWRAAGSGGCGRLLVDEGLEAVGEVAGQGLQQAGRLDQRGLQRSGELGQQLLARRAGRRGPRRRRPSARWCRAAPPLSTSSGFVRRRVAQRLGGGDRCRSPTNVRAVGPTSSSSSPSSAGVVGGEPGQGVLVHLVLGAAVAQRAAQRGQGAHLHAAVLGDEHRLGRRSASSRSRRRPRPSQHGGSPSRCTPPLASSRGARCESEHHDERPAHAETGDPVGRAPRLAGGPITRPDGVDQRSSASNRFEMSEQR